MQLGLFFILLSFSSAQAQTLQQKIDHSVLAAYDETAKPRTDVVSVERGYLMSNSGLKEYVQIKDEKFNAEVSGKTLDSKSAFSSIKDFFDTFVLLKKKSQTSLPAEKIEKEKATRQASVRVGSTLKNILASYRMARPVKIISINVCSTTGAQLQAYYKQEKFSLNQIESKDKNELSHTTQIQFKNVSGQETEQYVQTGSYQLPVYETYKYQLIQKNKVTPLTIAKVGVAKVNIDLPNVQMLNQFVDQSVTSTNTTQINKADGPIVKEELQKAWLLLKRVGACCNESACKQAMTSAGASPDSSGGMGTYVQ